MMEERRKIKIIWTAIPRVEILKRDDVFRITPVSDRTATSPLMVVAVVTVTLPCPSRCPTELDTNL